MERHQADQTVNECLRFIFNDRAVSRRAGGDASMGNVAQARHELALRDYGSPITIGITRAGLELQVPSSDFMPAGMIFDDDPAAEFEDATSPGAEFTIPDGLARFHA
jgi:hypothetical protein